MAILEDGHQRTIRWCAWSPDSQFIASCSFDGTASVWEVVDGEFDCVASLEGHENEVKSVCWSASGQLLATCGRDKSVFIWEAEDEAYEVAAVLRAHTADVKALAWHPKVDLLASASYDDTVRLYSPVGDDWHCNSTLAKHTSTVWALAFSEDGRGLVSCSDDRAVILWTDLKGDGSFEHSSTLADVHERAIYSVDWAPEASGGLIATAGADDAIGLLRASEAAAGTGGSDATAHVLTLAGMHGKAHTNDINSVAWRPTSMTAVGSERAGWLASCGDDGCVRLWHCEASNSA